MIDKIAFELIESRKITNNISKLEKILALVSIIFILSIELVVLIVILIIETIIIGGCKLAGL